MTPQIAKVAPCGVNKFFNWSERSPVVIPLIGRILASELIVTIWINPNSVKIFTPIFFILTNYEESFKIIYDARNQKMFAYLIPNTKLDSIEKYVVTVDSIESITGIDFIPN